MTIGRQLKKMRQLLNLSQSQMCAGIISESFYSKIEHDKNELSINKLLALLNAHNISLYNFFEEFDEENLSKIKLEKQVYTAFNNRNINQLRTIKRNLNNKDTIELLKINLMLATLNRQVYEIPEKFKKEIINGCQKVDLQNEKNFWNLAISTYVYNFNELSAFIDYILDNVTELDLTNDDMLVSLLNLIINYMDRCFRENSLNRIQILGAFVNQIPDSFAISFHKLIVKYYVALADNDIALANQIENLLNKSGYQSYIKTLSVVE